MSIDISLLKTALLSACTAATLVLAGCSSDSPQSLLSAGKAAISKSDPKTAVIHFKTALQMDPSLVEARVLLGQALLDTGDPAGAALELTKAMDQKADVAKVMPPLARALLLSGDYRKLTGVYGSMVIDDPVAMASVQSSVASAWGALGDKERTDAAVAAALKAAPDFAPAVILQARLLAGQREFDKALALVDRVLAKDDKQYEAWLLKGELIDLVRNDLKAADAAYRKSVELQPGYVPGHSALIGVRLRERDFEGAKAQAGELRKILPNHPMTLFVEAQIAFLEKNLVRARELSQQLLKMAPNHVGVLQLAGAVEGQLGSMFAAETNFAKALQVDPNLPVARRSLARVYILQGQPDKAMAVLKPLLDLSAESSADALVLAGEAELRRGDGDAAELYFARAAKYVPNDSRVRTALALTRLRRGEAAATFAELESVASASQDTIAEQAIVSARLRRREFGPALAAIDAMEKKQPGKALTSELKGRVLLAKRDLVGARQAFEEALKRDPAIFSAVSNLAAIDLMEKKPEQAAKRLEASVEADRRNHLAMVALAELKAQGNAPIDEVRKLLVEAATVAPQEAAPRLSLITLLLKKRLYKDALVAAQEAAAALPSDMTVLDAVGRAQMEAGDIEQAIGTFRKIAGADSNSALAYTRLADIFRATGKRSQAETALRKALEIDPDLLPAHGALVQLLVASGRQREVLEHFARLQRDRPTKASGYLIEAGYHLRNKAPTTAIAVYRKGLAQTDDPGIARALYKALLDHGPAGEGDKFGANWLRTHPQDAAFDFQVALTQIGRGELEAAEARLSRIVTRFPDNPLAVNNLAWVLASRGRPGAAAMGQRAVDLSPDNPLIMDTLALALASEKQFDKALETQRRAIEMAPRDETLRLTLARIAVQAGDKALARGELDRLKALGPAFARQDEVAKLSKQL